MRYYAARQRLSDGKWHYTVMNDGQVVATGYCARTCEGHDTPEEACAHQKAYEIDQLLIIGGAKTEKWPKVRCSYPKCDREGIHHAVIPGVLSDMMLCADHANRESVSEFYSVGERWCS